MELIFEFIVEFLLECIVGGAASAAKSHKAPTLLRFIAALFLILLYSAVIIGILIISIMMIIDHSIPAAIMLIAIDIVIAAACAVEFRKVIKKRKRNK